MSAPPTSPSLSPTLHHLDHPLGVAFLFGVLAMLSLQYLLNATGTVDGVKHLLSSFRQHCAANSDSNIRPGEQDVLGSHRTKDTFEWRNSMPRSIDAKLSTSLSLTIFIHVITSFSTLLLFDSSNEMGCAVVTGASVLTRNFVVLLSPFRSALIYLRNSDLAGAFELVLVYVVLGIRLALQFAAAAFNPGIISILPSPPLSGALCLPISNHLLGLVISAVDLAAILVLTLRILFHRVLRIPVTARSWKTLFEVALSSPFPHFLALASFIAANFPASLSTNNVALFWIPRTLALLLVLWSLPAVATSPQFPSSMPPCVSTSKSDTNGTSSSQTSSSWQEAQIELATRTVVPCQAVGSAAHRYLGAHHNQSEPEGIQATPPTTSMARISLPSSLAGSTPYFEHKEFAIDTLGRSHFSEPSVSPRTDQSSEWRSFTKRHSAVSS